MDINAYRVLISDEAGTTIADSSVQSGTEFVLSGIVPGTYDFTVQGIISGAENDYVIAESTETHSVTANARIAVVLKDAASGTAGDITLKVYAPFEGEYDPSQVRFTITGDGWKKTFVLPGDSEAKYMGSGTDEKGAYWIYLIRSTAGIRVGFCTIGLEIQASDGGEALTCTTGGMVYPGLTATGVVDSQKGMGQVATPVISEVTNLIGQTFNSTTSLKATVISTFVYFCYSDASNTSSEYFLRYGEEGDRWYAKSNVIYDRKLYVEMQTPIGLGDYDRYDILIGDSSDIDDMILLGSLGSSGDGFYANIPAQLINSYNLYFGVERIKNGQAYDSFVSSPLIVSYDLMQKKDIEITCSTPGAEIYYTLDGSEPSETSELYTGIFEVTAPVTIKAKAFKADLTPSEVSEFIVKEAVIPVSVPMALPDGSVLFYDRGEKYGEYHIGEDGYPMRNDRATDAGTAESENWRFLICDKEELGVFEWGERGLDTGTMNTNIGAGLQNTNQLIEIESYYTQFPWMRIKEKRSESGLCWFIPSKDELYMLYENKDIILTQGGISLQSSVYWSSSECSDYDSAWAQDFKTGEEGSDYKDAMYLCRLIRRI